LKPPTFRLIALFADRAIADDVTLRHIIAIMPDCHCRHRFRHDIAASHCHYAAADYAAISLPLLISTG
jgi:hypothetical protein